MVRLRCNIGLRQGQRANVEVPSQQPESFVRVVICGRQHIFRGPILTSSGPSSSLEMTKPRL
jgi:hypothetical protein